MGQSHPVWPCLQRRRPRAVSTSRDAGMSDTTILERHHAPADVSDRVAYAVTRLLRFFADAFFARRYGHRAVVLETVAAVPGMVGGALAAPALPAPHGGRPRLDPHAAGRSRERTHAPDDLHATSPGPRVRAPADPARARRLLQPASSCSTCCRPGPRIASSATSRRKRSTATPSTWPAWTTAPTPTSRRPRSPSITGSSTRTHACARSSSPSARTRAPPRRQSSLCRRAGRRNQQGRRRT